MKDPPTQAFCSLLHLCILITKPGYPPYDVGEDGPMKGNIGPNVIGGRSERPEGHPHLPIATSP